MKNRARQRADRLEKCKSELLEMCDNNPCYWQKRVLENIDMAIIEAKTNAMSCQCEAKEVNNGEA
jgi:hypothetical protein